MALLDTARFRIMISSTSASVRGGDCERRSAWYASIRGTSTEGGATEVGGGTPAKWGASAGGGTVIGGGMDVLMPGKLTGGGRNTRAGGGKFGGGIRGGGPLRRTTWGGGIPGGGTCNNDAVFMESKQTFGTWLYICKYMSALRVCFRLWFSTNCVVLHAASPFSFCWCARPMRHYL